jgi:2-dehydro-3-deoxygalactonokinase
MSDTAFYSCDFGTSSFRLRRVRANGEVAAERKEAVGVRDLYARRDPGDVDGRAGAFAAFLADQLRVLGAGDAGGGRPTVVVSGMASSSIGWRELPYAAVPFALDGETARTEVFGLDLGRGEPARVLLVSGLATADDVMRGEETELLGLFAGGRYAALAEDGLVILPGTHSKHVTLRGGRITGFHTYMTGEVFDTLARHTVLRASVEGDPAGDGGSGLARPANRTAFLVGVRTVAEMGLARSLFKVRARAVLGSADPAANRHFLSGLLVGAEAYDLRRTDEIRPILVAAPAETAEAYRTAFEALDLGPRLTLVPPEDVALAAVRGQAVLLSARSRS